MLFLDELPEWERRALEVLREPLESGVVTVSRAARSAEFPARFQLVAAMNPCPCGWAGDASGRCRCSSDAIQRYRGRISGPLLDRIDLHVEVPRLPPSELRPDAPGGEDTPPCARAWCRHVSASIDAPASPTHNSTRPRPSPIAGCRCTTTRLLERAVESLQLSARSMHRILRVARTIADLAGEAQIGTAHLTEAIGLRRAARGVDQS